MHRAINKARHAGTLDKRRRNLGGRGEGGCLTTPWKPFSQLSCSNARVFHGSIARGFPYVWLIDFLFFFDLHSSSALSGGKDCDNNPKKIILETLSVVQMHEFSTDLLRTSYNLFGSTIYCELLRICGASKSMYFYMLSRCGAANRMCFCANLLMRRSKNYVHPEAIEMMPQPLTASSRPKV